MQNHDLHKIKLPGEGQPLQVYAEFLMNLRGQMEFFDRGKGWISWLQGKALLRARKVAKRGTWGPFLKKVRIKPTTAAYLLTIAENYSAEQAKAKGYSEMLREQYLCYARKLDEEVEALDVEMREAVTSGATGTTTTADEGQGDDEGNKSGKNATTGKYVEPDPATRDIIKNLNLIVERLEEFRDSLPAKKPPTGKPKNVSEAEMRVKQAEKVLGQILSRLRSWGKA